MYYKIFGSILKVIYGIVGNNYLLALVIFTAFFRIILLPSTISQQKGAAKQMRMQTKLKRIQEKYKDYNKPDKQQLIQQEQQELYSREGYSSMTGSCMPLLIQLPIMYGLYGAIYKPLSYILSIGSATLEKFGDAAKAAGIELSLSGRVARGEMDLLNHFDEIIAQKPDVGQDVIESLRNFIGKFTAFGVPLYDTPSTDTFKHFGDATRNAKLLLLIPILACLTSLLTSVYTQMRQNKTNPQAAQMKSMGCMMFLMGPVMSLWITFSLPAAIGIYWIISNIVGFLQTFILGYTHEPKKVLAKLMVQETIERRSREENVKSLAGQKN